MKNFLVLFTAVIFSSVLGFSQGSKITGRIIAEENQKPIAHAHIDLMSMDSVIINQTVTGTNGRFQFQDVSEGSYRVAITHLEYEGLIFNLSVYKNTELGNISLKEKQYDIEVISVSGAGNLTRLDRELIIPAEWQVSNSANSMDLLSKLYLPGVRVDILENTIQGNNLQIRINDIIATTNDLIAILPDDVLRVEHITMPGAEYGAEVGEVINIITKKRISGITGGVNLTNWINGIYGNDNVNFKANHKDSEFALNYTFGYSRYGKVYQNSSEIFLLKDGSEFTRKRDGLPGTQKLFTHSPSVNYNLRKDNITLNMLLRGDIYDLPVNKASTLISDETDAISSQSHISNKYYRPSADIYLKTNFKNNQYLIVDVLGTYTNTDYSRTYTEIYRDQSSETFDYKTDGDKYSLIAEARYGMTFKNNDNFSAGLKYDQSYMNNLYKNFNGDVLSDDKLNNYDMYMFTQYQGAVKEFRYGVGAGYSRQYYSMNGKKRSFNAFRPNLNLMYPFGKFIARYNFAINTMNPQLSQLSEFEQWQNAYEVTVGNPLLKPSRSIVNALNLQFSTEKIELSINTYH